MKKTKPVFITILLISLYITGNSQPNLSDSSLSDPQISTLYNQYITGIGGASLLYNGSEYTNTYPGAIGTPYFEATDFETGTVWYNGIRYNNIPLKYNLVSGELVTKGFQNESINLVREKIDSFYVLRHLFIKVAGDSSDLNTSGYRFYDLLYNGKNISFLVKREKIIKAPLHAEDPSTFATYTSYYLVKDNVFYKAGSKKEAMNILGKGNDAMKAYWKNNKLDFKRDIENAITKSAEYYDQLKK